MERRKTPAKGIGIEERFDRIKHAFDASMVPWNHGRTRIFLKPEGENYKLVLKHNLKFSLHEEEKRDRPLLTRMMLLKARLNEIPGLEVRVEKTPFGGGNFVHEIEVSHEGKPFELKKLDTIPHLASLKGVYDLREAIRRETRVLRQPKTGRAGRGEILLGEIPHQ